jgi:accessory gene regulator B
MIERLSARLADAFIVSGAAKEEDRDVYVYGLDVLLSTSANILCMLAIGILLNLALEAAVFLLLFSVLRSAAGGYHADTHFKCFLILLGAFGASMALVALLPPSACLWMAPAFAFMSVTAVLALAPAPHENRPVSAREIIKFRRLSLMIVAAESAVVLLCLLLNAGEAALAASLGMLASASSLCASHMQGRRKRKAGAHGIE